MARVGDRIRCSVMFENEQVINGKVQFPVSFFMNGRKIITKEEKDHFFVDADKALYPYIGIIGGASVAAKVRIRNGR